MATNTHIPDGRYTIKAVSTARLLTDADGLLAAVASWTEPQQNQIWQLTNISDQGATLQCIGTSRYLSMSTKMGPYYVAADEPELWRFEPPVRGDGHDIIRTANDRRVWLSGFLLDSQPVWQQGVDPAMESVPAQWLLASV
ncbi:hypothetical protein KGQ20_39255 [Catenulispora sp. NF23]|uniref:hypothetical protein n=1 Tax=Catenulispora pinistramenti TaxID=2705254 RepID=UPI001BA5F89C|nr:hypothetical protein [Catenulispora pinistramenti]MBS2538802.1 hypothetical protein [Catenulispora pinistramenti]